MKLPQARTNEIVVQNLEDELLIYNLMTDQAFALNEIAKIVYEACDGTTSFAEVRSKHQLTDETIHLALDELKKENLIQDEYVSPFAGLSRREVIKKVGLATMVALPAISALVAPQASQAASARGLFAACSTSSDCGNGTLSCNRITSGAQAGSRVCCASATGRGGTGADFLGGNSAMNGLSACDSCKNLLAQSCCSNQIATSSFTCNEGSDGVSAGCRGRCT